jgi:hypothetical protein
MTGLTIRQQMAKGSKWKVKTDFSVENKYGSDYGWKSNPTPEYPKNRDLVQTVKRMVDFKSGEIITIADKSTTYHPKTYEKGLFIPVTCDSRKDAYAVFECKDISDKFELEKAVEQLIFVFWSPSLGYIKDIPWKHDEHEFRDEYKSPGYDEAKKSGGINFSDKLTKAMKKKRLQDTKTFLLSHSGYYDNIDTSDIYYVFEPGGEKVDFPEDLEVQTVDKATKEVKNKFQASDYLKDAFRLRPLTLKYGSSIRSVFKDMEEKGKDFSTLLMFQDLDEDVDTYEPSDKVKALKEEFKSLKLNKASYIMKSDYRTAAFAFENRNDALMFRLSYNGSLEVKLVDAETLTEVKAVI